MHHENRRWPWLFLGLFVVVADWLSKQWVLSHLQVGEALKATSYLNFHVVFNRGMAFGFLNGQAGWQIAVLSVLALVVVAALLVWMFVAEKPSLLFLSALALVIGGAIGNAIDRIQNAMVTDFVDFHLHGWHFWTFNVADTAITVGIVFLLLDWVLESK